MQLTKKIKVAIQSEETTYKALPIAMTKLPYGENLSEIDSEHNKDDYQITTDTDNNQIAIPNHMSAQLESKDIEDVEVEVLTDEGKEFISNLETKLTEFESKIKELEDKVSNLPKDNETKSLEYSDVRKFVTANFGQIMFEAKLKSSAADIVNGLLTNDGIEYKNEYYMTNDADGNSVQKERAVANVPSSAKLYPYLTQLAKDNNCSLDKAIEKMYRKFYKTFTSKNESMLNNIKDDPNGLNIVNSMDSNIYDAHISIVMSETLPEFCSTYSLPTEFSTFCTDVLSEQFVKIAIQKMSSQDNINQSKLKYIEAISNEQVERLRVLESQTPNQQKTEQETLRLN